MTGTVNTNQFKYVVLNALLLVGCPFFAIAEPDALFIEATRLLHHDRPLYAYTVVTTGREEVLTEQFDPSLEETQQWRLITVNDEVPSADRVKKYLQQKQKQLEDNPPRTFDDMVDTSTLFKMGENEREVLYQFQPVMFEDKPELNEKFVGKIVINKADSSIKQMEYSNTGKIKPVPVVTLEQLDTLVEFKILPDGQPVASKIVIHTQGTAFIFKKFDAQVVQDYSNYRQVVFAEPLSSENLGAAPGARTLQPDPGSD